MKNPLQIKSHREWMEKNLRETFGLSDNAVATLMSLWDLSQYFDDLADGDEVSRQTHFDMIWKALVEAPANPLHQALVPFVANAIVKWRVSDKREREGRACHKTHMLRAAFYDCVLQAIILEKGQEFAIEAGEKIWFELYAEPLEEYLSEWVDSRSEKVHEPDCAEDRQTIAPAQSPKPERA